MFNFNNELNNRPLHSKNDSELRLSAFITKYIVLFIYLL